MGNEKQKLKTIGKVTVDLVKLSEYLKTEQALDDYINKYPAELDEATYHLFNSRRYNYLKEKWYVKRCETPKLQVEGRWYTLDNGLLDYVKLAIDFLTEVKLDVHKKVDEGYHIVLPKNKEKSWFVSTEFIVEENIYQTFDDITIDAVLALKGGSTEEVTSALATIGSKSKNEIRLDIENRKAEILAAEKDLEQQIKDAEKKFDLMKSEMKLKMAEMMTPMITEVENMNDQLHMFESQIYSTLSFMGMTIDIEQLIEGKRAEMDETLVIWQELRYLDEELPKLTTLYDVYFEDFKTLEKIIVENQVVRDYFLPNQKTITVFKTSKLGATVTYSEVQRKVERGDKQIWSDVVMSTVDLQHGNKIALMMRDGENIYMAWTDEDKIHIKDGKLFYTDLSRNVDSKSVDFAKLKDVAKYEPASKGYAAMDNIKTTRENYKKRRAHTADPLTRVYLKSIIEGLLERGDILRIPEKEDIRLAVMGKGHYIRFKSDDLLLKDTTYGTLEELLEKSQRGDAKWDEPLYCIDYTNSENRTRGYNERGHDAYLTPGLSNVNLIEYTYKYYARLYIDPELHLVKDKRGRWDLNEFGETINRARNVNLKKPNDTNIYHRISSNKGVLTDTEALSDWKGAYFEYKMHTIEKENSAKVPEYDWTLEDEVVTKTRYSWREGKDVEYTETIKHKRPLSDYCYSLSTGEKWEPKEERDLNDKGRGVMEDEPDYRLRNSNKVVEIDDVWYMAKRFNYTEAGFVAKEEYRRRSVKTYVSVEKRYGGNSNVSVHPGEYLNLILWCSQWIEYAIRNKYTFRGFFDGSYAKQLPHFQNILEYLRKQEKEFYDWCVEAGREELPKNWQIMLIEWRVETGHRNHTKFRAKQFVKYLKKNNK